MGRQVGAHEKTREDPGGSPSYPPKSLENGSILGRPRLQLKSGAEPVVFRQDHQSYPEEMSTSL